MSNRVGFIVKQGDQLVETSHHSALSGQVVISGAVTRPVPGTPGLYVRLAGLEARDMTQDQADTLYAAARTWYETHFKGGATAADEDVTNGESSEV